ncbi:MAG: alpha/beta hydrolase fold domain-containing protein [Saprospiraceae bacterium]|nr:alpha/beta hydrolase fold domain-containing protein [Saprospiraceae bacterium]
MLSIIIYAVFIYSILLICVPRGNFVSEGLHLPFWLFTVHQLAKPKPKGQKIKYGSHFRQYLLHFPAAPESEAKQFVVIYTHGSGWQFGRPEMFKANAQWLAEQGYHAFFLTHRRIPQCDIRQLREDMALGIKTVVDELQRLGLSDKKIILCGNSAGGHLSALALFDKSLLNAVQLNPSLISAAVFFSSPLDFSAMWNSPPLLMLTRMKDENLLRLANPITYVDKASTIPILLVHGGKDGLVEIESSISFHRKLQELGTRNLRFEILKGGTHLDAASWCFPMHPCNKVFSDWLEKLENQ